MTPAERQEFEAYMGGRARALGRCPGGAVSVRVRDLTAKCVEPCYRTLCPGDVGYTEALRAKRIDATGRPYAIGGECHPFDQELGWTGDPSAPIQCVSKRRAMQELNAESRRRGPATQEGMSPICPNGRRGVLVPDRHRGTIPTYTLICPGEPGYEQARARRDDCSGPPLGDAASDLRAMPLPGSLERYLATGAAMPAWKRDLGAMSAQVPRYVYGIGAVLAIVLASRAYKRWRDEK